MWRIFCPTWSMRYLQRNLGPRAEWYAARYLWHRGYRIVGRNVQWRDGELDIVAVQYRPRCVIFVEVKAATQAEPVPETHVDYVKQRQLSRLADRFLQQPRWQDWPGRFDVIGIVWPERAIYPAAVRHHVAAFAQVG